METLEVKKDKVSKAKQKARKLSGSAALLEVFLSEKVDTIFGYPGGAIMPIYDALYDYQQKMKHILVRHEQGAIHAAQGYARTSGKTGVVFATSGPGATNLVTGLADAMIDSTPLVCITGQVLCAFTWHRCLPGNRCDQYHHPGYQMELPGYRCNRNSIGTGQSILYCCERKAGSCVDRYYQKCADTEI